MSPKENNYGNSNNVGLVEPKSMQIVSPPESLELESGAKLSPVTVQYETYGALTEQADNAILICHALSGDAHAAGRHHPDDRKPGWWDDMIGPGKAFDTNRYFVICSNILGGCKGTTGPASINPETGAPYGIDFPVITVRDMVVCQKLLLDKLGIPQLLAVSGGSLGGMQALEWAVRYPEHLGGAIPIATPYRMSAQGIALNEVGRQAIFADANWAEGRYTPEQGPDTGLALARMIAHISYLSAESMHRKFGRDLRRKDGFTYNFEQEFQVESYLHYQGSQFTERFDANTYLYLTKAMDYFDITRGFRSLRESLTRARAKFLLISFYSDWLFPTSEVKDIANALRSNGSDVTYVDVNAEYGHDSFLLEYDTQTRLIAPFLRYLYEEEEDEFRS